MVKKIVEEVWNQSVLVAPRSPCDNVVKKCKSKNFKWHSYSEISNYFQPRWGRLLKKCEIRVFWW